MSIKEGIISIPANVIINSGVTPHFVAGFTLFIGCLLLGTICIGRLLRILFRIPPIAGQIIGGIFLGPTLLNIASWGIFSNNVEFTDYDTGTVYSFISSDLFVLFVFLLSAGFTVAYLLWTAGHETDIQDMIKVGFTAAAAGVLGALVPILVIAKWLMWMNGMDLIHAIGIGLIFAATSVSIPVAMFFAQNKMHLQSSKATLGAAIIDDIFAVVLLSMFMMGLQTGLFGNDVGVSIAGHTSGILDALGYMLVAFLAFGIFGYFCMVPFVDWVRKRERVYLIAATATVFMFFFFAFSELIGGLAGITGAYFAGMFHRMADKKHLAVKTISPYLNAIFLPLFLGSIGLQINLQNLSAANWRQVAILTFLAILTKFIGTYLATTLSNLFGQRNKFRWSILDGYIFSSAMVARGEVGLVIATLLKGVGILTFSSYVVSVVVIILTTIISPMMLTLGFKWMDKYPETDTEHDYVINIGQFKSIGTMQMFNVVLGIIESEKKGVNTTIQLSEGRKIANLEGLGVKIIYAPTEGVILEGKKSKIDKILHLVRKRMAEEMEHIVLS
jgi:Kef-type K+ transport system membrane component KefB